MISEQSTAPETGRDPDITTGWRIVSLCRRHPLTSYFVLANVLSWSAWAPYVLSENGLTLWAFHVSEVLGSSQLLGALPGAFLGPIAAAFLLTALVADGMTNNGIADALVVEVATVTSHLARLLPELGVRSRLQAVVRAYQNHVITTVGE